MIIKCATKRDINGNRKYLAVDTENKTYSTTPAHWYTRGDFIQITNKERHALLEKAQKENYTGVNAL